MPIYMKYPGVEGTGKGNHKGWIELQSAQLGVHRNVKDPTGSSTNREASVPSVSEIVVTKDLDIASSGLVQEALWVRWTALSRPKDGDRSLLSHQSSEMPAPR